LLTAAQRACVYLQLLDNGGGVLAGLGLAAQVTGQGLALGEGVEDGPLDAVGVVVETHVPQHHDGAEQQGSGVGQVLAGNVGGRTVDGLEDGALVTNVARGGQAETTDEAGAHVGQNVTVQVGHDQDLVVVRVGVGDHLEAGVVEQLSVELDVGEVLGDVTGDGEEETVRHLHDGGLVDNADLLAANGLGVLEGIAQDALAGLAGDELDALDNTVDNNVLDARVLALGVLADEDRVDTVVGGLEAGDGAAGTQVGEEVEGTTQGKVQRDVALANGGGQRTLESNLVLVDVLNGGVGDGGLAVLQDGGDVDSLPSNRGLEGEQRGQSSVFARDEPRFRISSTNLGGGEDVLDGLGNLGANAVTLDEADEVVALSVLGRDVLGNTVAGSRVETGVHSRPRGDGAGSCAQALSGHRAGQGANGQHFELGGNGVCRIGGLRVS
jgi:hypothetical protein